MRLPASIHLTSPAIVCCHEGNGAGEQESNPPTSGVKRSNALLRHLSIFSAQSIRPQYVFYNSRNRRGRNKPNVFHDQKTIIHCSLFTIHSRLVSFLPVGEKQIQINHEKNTLGKNQYVKYRVHYSKEGNSGLEPEPPGGFARRPHPRTHLPFSCIH